jgi:hypothetical protein
MSASAMMSAITPTATPIVEIREMSEMNACLRLAKEIAKGDEEFERHVDTELYQEPLTVELPGRA